MTPQAADRQARILRIVILAETGAAVAGAAIYEAAPVLRPAITSVGTVLAPIGALALVATRLLSDFGRL